MDMAIALPKALLSNYIEAVNQTMYHVRAGNLKLLEKRYLGDLVQDVSWKTELSIITQWITRIIVTPLN